MGSLANKIKSVHKRLNDIKYKDNPNFVEEEERALEATLENLLTKKEIYWNQRSRVNWLQMDDLSTAYFYKSAFAHRKRNGIRGLLDSNNFLHTGQIGMERIMTDYYSDLFSSTGPLKMILLRSLA